jgi:exodeoxyribonuclease VII small subunit
LSFEQALVELERIVRDLEDGQTGLEESLTRYEAGVHLLKRCYQQLAQAEQRILLVTGQDAEGKAVTQPFEHAATAETERPESKRRRKKSDDPESLY